MPEPPSAITTPGAVAAYAAPAAPGAAYAAYAAPYSLDFDVDEFRFVPFPSHAIAYAALSEQAIDAALRVGDFSAGAKRRKPRRAVDVGAARVNVKKNA